MPYHLMLDEAEEEVEVKRKLVQPNVVLDQLMQTNVHAQEFVLKICLMREFLKAKLDWLVPRKI